MFCPCCGSDGYPLYSHHRGPVRYQISLCTICGGQIDTATGTSPSTSTSHCHYHSTCTPHSSPPYRKDNAEKLGNLPKRNALAVIKGHWIEKYFHSFFKRLFGMALDPQSTVQTHFVSFKNVSLIHVRRLSEQTAMASRLVCYLLTPEAADFTVTLCNADLHFSTSEGAFSTAPSKSV